MFWMITLSSILWYASCSVRYLSTLRDTPMACTLSTASCAGKSCWRPFGRRNGNYLIALYTGVKLLQLGNVLGQLAMLNQLLGSGYHLYGVEVIRLIIAGVDWTTTSRFPRTTMCDMKVCVCVLFLLER